MKNYFKKFSIIFVILLAVIGIGVIQNGVVANAATIGKPSEQAEAGWHRYDGHNSTLKYIAGNWIYGTDDTYYYSYDRNAAIQFDFTGNKLRLYHYQSGSNRTNNAEIWIDGIKVSNVDLYNIGIGAESSHNILFYENTNLTDGVHSVKIVNNGTGYLEIDGIDVDTAGELKPYDENIIGRLITLNNVAMNLTVGDLGQLTATTTPAGAQVTWTSSDTSIATVDSTGKVTGVKEGTCTITAATADGLTATCKVNVTKKTDPNPNPTPNPQPTGSDTIVNTAHAKGDNTNNPGGDVIIIFHGAADTTLSVVKTADVKEVWVGDTVTYTIVVTNTGTKTAKAVVVNDPAPNHIDFNVNAVTTTQGTVDSSSTSKNIVVNVGDIPPAGTVTITIPATVIA